MKNEIKQSNIGKLYHLPIKERSKEFLRQITKAKIDDETENRRQKFLKEYRKELK